MDEGLILLQATATRAACARMTAQHLRALHDSVEHACCLRGRFPWDRRAAAHAEIFTLLADMTDDPALAPVLRGAAGVMHHLVLVVGPAANGMIVSSRQRLLAYMRAGDADGAALEMEQHLRGLHFMWRLARSPAASWS
jgi:GntR family transcriptional regulator, transcriptional repressor for pyruvate dehydrogenase complex